MTVNDKDIALASDDIDRFESSIGLRLPGTVRSFYLSANGGTPEPYVFENEDIDTVVAEILPLFSGEGRGTVGDAYRRLVQEKKLVPATYLPFAVDGGGDYFFADCSDAAGSVYFFRGDTATPEEALVSLKVTFAQFWERLKEE